MNIPFLKCARGYHKSGGEFKVLYSAVIFVFLTARLFNHLQLLVNLPVCSFGFRTESKSQGRQYLKCNINSWVVQPCQAIQEKYHFRQNRKDIYFKWICG